MNPKGATSAQSHIPNIPRGTWPDHPRFPKQTLLLGSHANFRKIATHLVERVAAFSELADDRPRVIEDGRELLWLFLRWQGAMGGHEGYEERKLYPFLNRRFGVATDFLNREHEALHRARDVVEAAFVELLSDRVGPAQAENARSRLEDALRAYRETLNLHLEAEEDTVIPCLLALEPEEFERFTWG